MKKFVLFILTALFTGSLFCLAECSPKHVLNCSLSAEQVQGEQKINVSWDLKDSDMSKITKAAIEVNHDGKQVSETEINFKAISGKTAVYAYYGKQSVQLKVDFSDGGFGTFGQAECNLYADEYNFAGMNASLPVLYMSLDYYSMDETVKTGYVSNNIPVMANVPTFVFLERAGAYNWDDLPQNIFKLPTADKKDFDEGNFHNLKNAMFDYIAELHEIHPESKFNLYCVDNYPELILQCFTAQGIENYTVNMISDGTGTYSIFAGKFGSAEAETTYNEMTTEWNRLKEAAKNGENFLNNVLYGNNGYQVLENYAFVIATVENNVTWWCSRADLLTNNTKSDFIKDLIGGTNDSGKNANLTKTHVIYPSLSKMLSFLSDTAKTSFKTLYKFDDEVFSSAYEHNKEALLIIGTKTENLSDLGNYVKLLRKYYGEKYEIFYKGHPGAPTMLDPHKQELLKNLNVTDVNSTIAAEIILFYCPDINLVGYRSSTFLSADKNRILALFNTSSDEVSGYGAQLYFNAVTKDGKTLYRIDYASGVKYSLYNPQTDTLTDYTL